MISDFAKEKVFWSRSMNIKLVKFIESRPNIWNPAHPKYTSLECRDQTYAEFAAKYGNEFTGKAVKERWTNIRCTFAFYLRKMKTCEAKGDGQLFKVNWHLWDACSFLLRVNKKNKSSNDGECIEEEIEDDAPIPTEELSQTISETAKKKVFWTRKMNLRLVKFIESKPNIWNPKHSKYSSAFYRDQTFAEFAAKYGNKFTGESVKARWTNIRCSFAYNFRKFNLSEAKGKRFQVNWHLWDACSFLLKVHKKNKLSNETECFEDDIEENGVIDEEESSSNDDTSSIRPRNADTTCQNIANGIFNVFRGIQNNIFDTDKTKYAQLGDKINSKLSQMSSFEAAQATSKVMDILLLYHEDNPLNPNNVKPEINLR